MQSYLLPIATLSIAIVCWTMMFLVLFRDRRGVKAAFAYLALTHNLHITEQPHGATSLPSATGTYKGRTLTVMSEFIKEVMPRRSLTRVCVSLANPVEGTLRITPVTPGAAMLTKHRIATDQVFDRRYIAEGSQTLGDRVLSPDVRNRMLSLAEAGMAGTYDITETQVIFKDLGLIHNDARLRDIIRAIDMLYDIAAVLDR